MADSRITSLLILSSGLWAACSVLNYFAQAQGAKCSYRPDLHTSAQCALLLIYSSCSNLAVKHCLGKLSGRQAKVAEFVFGLQVILVPLLPISTLLLNIHLADQCEASASAWEVWFYKLFSWAGSLVSLPVSLLFAYLVIKFELSQKRRRSLIRFKRTSSETLLRDIGTSVAWMSYFRDFVHIVLYPIEIGKVELYFLRYYMVWSITPDELKALLPHRQSCSLCNCSFKNKQEVFVDLLIENLFHRNRLSHWSCFAKSLISIKEPWGQNPAFLRLIKVYNAYPMGQRDQLPRFFEGTNL